VTARVWVNGELTDVEAARVSPFDHGLLVGDGVFETLRVYDGRPFAWTRHLDRLEHSADGLGLPVPERVVVQAAAAAVLDANALRDARLRITVTGGVQPLGSERRATTPTVIVAASELRSVPGAISVVVVPWARNERGATAGLKTVSYGENVRALAYAQARGAGEAVFPNTRDELCEATGSNIFVVDDDVVRTPPASSGCLLGVTRALVLELCAELGLAHEEVTMPVDVLARAGEVFLTSTTREVQAVTQVDGRALSNTWGVTTCLAEAFTALVARNLDP
jgi:branched-chain amino acid aminotransferase